MPKKVQLRRGTTAQHASFTGADGEVTVDTDKRALVLHDGVTAGGKVILPTSNFLYQATSDSLNTGTIETSLFGSGEGSLVIPASFMKAGNTLRARFEGYITSPASPSTLTLQNKLTTNLNGLAVTLPASLSGGRFSLEALVVCRVGGEDGNGVSRLHLLMANQTTGAVVAYHGSDTFDWDWTVAKTYNVTGAFGAASHSLRIESAYLEVLR